MHAAGVSDASGTAWSSLITDDTKASFLQGGVGRQRAALRRKKADPFKDSSAQPNAASIDFRQKEKEKNFAFHMFNH